MTNEFVGEFIAFKGDDEYCDKQNMLLEVVEVKGDVVEIAFFAPLPGKPRCYVSFSLAELVKHAMPADK